MKIDIHIRDNQTGELVVYHDDFEWEGWAGRDDPSPDHQISFMWGDGNYACDCNRALYFEAAKTGVWPKNLDCECGDERYTVEKIVERGTGRVVYEDG